MPVALSVGPADLGCHGDGCRTPLATVTVTADFRVVSASHLGRQNTASYLKSNMISAKFLHHQARKVLKNTVTRIYGPSFRNVVIGAS